MKTYDKKVEAALAWEALPDRAITRHGNDVYEWYDMTYSHILPRSVGAAEACVKILADEVRRLRLLEEPETRGTTMAAELRAECNNMTAQERADATEAAMALINSGDTIERLRAENTRLKQWKAEQLQVEACWDPQKIGKLLGMPLGMAIRANIEHHIIKLIARAEAAEKELETINAARPK